jgi:beta-barrel assembly-enhancing protease
MKERPFPTRVLALFLTLLMIESGWAATPTSSPELPDPGSVGITKQEQEQVGRQAMAEVYKQVPVLPDSSPESQYVRQLGKKLAAVIPQEYSWPYEFHVIPQKDINAFALPGGPMFVNVGTLVAADNEAELAGVMAHEMSHVYLQHSAKQASKAQWTNMLGALGGLFGGGVAGGLARLGIQLGAGTLMLKYSRNDEAQADAVGAIILYKAGYDPKALAEFFQKLEQQAGGNGPQFLSDHPNPGNRQAAIDKEISHWPPRTYNPTSQAFIRTKELASGIKTYTPQQIADGAKQGAWAQQNRQSGAIPTNLPAVTSDPTAGMDSGALASVTFQQIRPSNNLNKLQHSAFSISYPENWQASGNRQSAVTIAPQAGVAEGAIAYGVVIGAAQDQNASSLDQAAADLVQSLQQSNPELRVSADVQAIEVNGLEGRSVYLIGTSSMHQNGESIRERDWLVTVPRPQGGLLYLVFIAPDRDFGQLRSTYQRMLGSLQLR